MTTVEEGAFEPRDDWRVAVEVDELEVTPLAPGRALIKVEWTFLLYRDEENIVADFNATLRLQYRTAETLDADGWRDLAVRFALSDGWPVWRSWLVMMLGSVGFPPPPLPVLMPPIYRKRALEVLKLSHADDADPPSASQER